MYGNIPISQEGANILLLSISSKENEKNIQIKKKKMCVYMAMQLAVFLVVIIK